jgi:VIT1/CCC1 family predicted Fe2+/Mn2+ transporter
MRDAIRKGLCFGTTSGIITTLGLMVGLHAGTHSRLAVIGGILTIAIADAFSDSLGIHISEESGKKKPREVWQSTLFTFASKFVFALTFMVPIMFLELSEAMVVSVAWGLLILGILSFYVARREKASPWKVVGEHLTIALVVIVATHYVGDWIGVVFN